MNSELPPPLYAKIISYRMVGTWAWVLQFATTEEAVRRSRRGVRDGGAELPKLQLFLLLHYC